MDRNKRLINVEFRALEEDNKMVIEGYPIVFDQVAEWYGFKEVVDKNALNGCDMSDVPLRYNHKEGYLILARTRNNSLQLMVDDKGLKMRAELIDTQTNKDIYKSIQSGLIDKMSFGFETLEEDYNYDEDKRTILKIKKLWDVSVVDQPYYDGTSVEARNLDNSKEYFEGKKKEKEKRNLINRIDKEILITKTI